MLTTSISHATGKHELPEAMLLVSEWLLLTSTHKFLATCMSWREQVNFQRNDDEVHLVLYQQA